MKKIYILLFYSSFISAMDWQEQLDRKKATIEKELNNVLPIQLQKTEPILSEDYAYFKNKLHKKGYTDVPPIHLIKPVNWAEECLVRYNYVENKIFISALLYHELVPKQQIAACIAYQLECIRLEHEKQLSDLESRVALNAHVHKNNLNKTAIQQAVYEFENFLQVEATQKACFNMGQKLCEHYKKFLTFQDEHMTQGQLRMQQMQYVNKKN